MNIHTDANRTGKHWSNSLWSTCPWQTIKDNPGMGFTYESNFTPATVATGERDYTLTVVGAGSATLAGANAHGGQIVLDTGATTTDKGANVNPGGATSAFIVPSAATTSWFETLVKFTTISTAPASFIGFSTQATGLATTGLVDGTDYIGFYSTATNTLKFTYKDGGGTQYLGSALTIYGSTTTYTTAQWIKLGFKVDGLTTVTPFINGVMGTPIAATTTYPIPDAIMNICYSIICKGTVQPTLTIDWVRFACRDESIGVVSIA